MYFDVSRKLEPPNLIGLMKMQLDMRARRDVFPRHRRCRNRVNLIWLALGIQNATNISLFRKIAFLLDENAYSSLHG